MTNSLAMDAWCDEARNVLIQDAFAKLRSPPKLFKFIEGERGPCPICRDGTDRFDLNLAKNSWFCRSCGGGNSVDLLVKADGLSFLHACEILTGTKAPNGWESNAQPVDESIMRERREERAVAKAITENEEQRKRREKRAQVQKVFAECSPFQGSLAEKYLAKRKIFLMPDQTKDLRFVSISNYMGYADAETKVETKLGEYPAMVSAIRNYVGEIIGIHRTYIDPETCLKLKPPGPPMRNGAKKVWGEQQHGHIALGRYQEVMAIGEGIETTASWYQLGIGPDQVGIMCSINLGNLSGGSLEMIKHPENPNLTIQNGEPDPDKRGLILPSIVRRVIILIDGDSDPLTTKAKILTAGRRWRADGIEVDICHPNIKGDFNDILMRAN
jgi:hypothetical protein